jgi:uncharacterized membrane protein YkvA (DUF1232 family)
MEKLKGALIVLFSFIYLLNVTGGIVEIPDNLPFAGNIDEFFFSALLVAALKKYFGVDITEFVGKKLGKGEKDKLSE